MLMKLRKEGQLDIDMAQSAVRTMMQSVMRNPDAMVWLSKMKQFETYLYQHSINCTIWGLAFARYLGLDRQSIYDVGLGCMLFDVGKIRLPGNLLEKPAALAPLELHIVRSHVEYSVSILEQSKDLNARVMQMVHSHHERFDGSGYPDCLAGSSIPTFAKIAGMVDSYDAMLSPRPYARQYTPYEAIRQIYQWRGNLFQPEVVEQFMQVVGVFPTGTLVELNTGSVGVVIAQNDARRLRPRVMLLLDEHKRR
ncbi:MAG: HD-GYP domain-containing protein, partial [Gammaproteobacteria bacterium]